MDMKWGIQDGSILLRLIKQGDDLLTEWVTMKPLYQENENLIGVFLREQKNSRGRGG